MLKRHTINSTSKTVLGEGEIVLPEQNALYKKHRYRYLNKRRPKDMTCIIGATCIDGVMIAGDRRILRGTEYSNEKKISEPFPGFVVGASGISGLMDKFLFEMNLFLHSEQAKGLDWRKFLLVLEDIAKNLFERYNERLEYEEAETGAYYFQVLYGCKEYQDKSKLYHLYREGLSVEVKTFDIIGHGQDKALPFVKTLYNEKRTMLEMAKVATFTLKLIDEANIDVSVGGKPQIYLIPNNGSARELSDQEIDALLNGMSPSAILETLLKL